jgi:hypothetical protein
MLLLDFSRTLSFGRLIVAGWGNQNFTCVLSVSPNICDLGWTIFAYSEYVTQTPVVCPAASRLRWGTRNASGVPLRPCRRFESRC